MAVTLQDKRVTETGEELDAGSLQRNIAAELGLKTHQVSLFHKGEIVSCRCHHRDGPRKVVLISDAVIHDGRFKSSSADVMDSVHRLEHASYVIQVRHLLPATRGARAMVRYVMVDPYNVNLEVVKRHIAHLG